MIAWDQRHYKNQCLLQIQSIELNERSKPKNPAGVLTLPLPRANPRRGGVLLRLRLRTGIDTQQPEPLQPHFSKSWQIEGTIPQHLNNTSIPSHYHSNCTHPHSGKHSHTYSHVHTHMHMHNHAQAFTQDLHPHIRKRPHKHIQTRTHARTLAQHMLAPYTYTHT
jgi:hypothetical protein